jgi:hypothetical protein
MCSLTEHGMISASLRLQRAISLKQACSLNFQSSLRNFLYRSKSGRNWEIVGFTTRSNFRRVRLLGQTGPDEGKGGKYLIVGPGQAEPPNTEGYIGVHSTHDQHLARFPCARSRSCEGAGMDRKGAHLSLQPARESAQAKIPYTCREDLASGAAPRAVQNPRMVMGNLILAPNMVFCPFICSYFT